MQLVATLPASDMERARDWYARVLQLEPAEITSTGDAWYEIGGARFLLYGSEFAGTNQATAASIQVEDVAATVAELRERGAVFENYDFGEEFRTVDGILTAPDGRKVAWMKDSEGNILAVGGN
jgi:catechol 2,3-dioxygenase-like lactoylglutathione lyase family enzyme